MICLSETWNSDESFSNDSTLHLPNYNPIHFGRKNKRVCVFVNERFIFKRRDDLSVSDDTNETLSIEVINKNKNIIVSTCYRPPAGKIKQFKKHITHIFDKITRENKKLFMVGDFNINSLSYAMQRIPK